MKKNQMKCINITDRSKSICIINTGKEINYLTNIKGKTDKTKSKKKIENNKIFTKKKQLSFNNNKVIYKYNDYEMNLFEYKIALIYDKRTYFEYYWSLLRAKHIFLFSFIPNNDYNSPIIKMSLFFFSFALYYTINALFYTDSTMHNIYLEHGNYDIIYQLPKIFYSNLISTVINTFMYFLSLSEKVIIQQKQKKKKNNLFELKKILLTKIIFYYIFYFIFLAFFWFYVSLFCIVYKNTQLYLIKDTLISFSFSLLYPLGFYLLPGLLRIPALKNRKKNKECIYKLSKLIQTI